MNVGADLAPRSAAADSYLAHFAGTWVGQGALRPSSGAAQETVYCRITAELSPDGTTLQQSGRCAVGEQSLPVAGVLVYDPPRGAVAGSWRGREGPVNIAGHRRDNRLVMQLKYKVEGRDASTTMTLEPVSDSRYRMLLAGSDGKGEVEFRRQ
jgi:hypothetical protein